MRILGIYVIKVRKFVVSSSSYAMLVFYRGCDFLEEKKYASPLDALIDCLNIILWQEFSKEEETEIKKYKLNMIIPRKNWYQLKRRASLKILK